MSFREQSVWVLLIALVASLAFYALPVLESGLWPSSVQRVVVTVVALVVLAAAGHGLLAVWNRGEDSADERDAEVDRRTDKIGDMALSAVVIGILAYAMAKGDWVLANIAFFGLFGAAALKALAMIVLYRLNR
ncbi:MAG: hypothetical protein V2I43_20700 [Parvularcula sp.]|jgi:hypothetical protein|nr:hypothetical protein [Parvularcula sp.]